MSFKVDKYKAMHLGENNLNHAYMMLNLERDLRVTVEGSLQLSFNTQQQQPKKPNKILVSIRRVMRTRKKASFYLMCTHLKYSVQFLSPHCKKDLEEGSSQDQYLVKRY